MRKLLVLTITLSLAFQGAGESFASRSHLRPMSVKNSSAKMDIGQLIDTKAISRSSDLIYKAYSEIGLERMTGSLQDLGTSPLEIKNMLKNLMRKRFVRLLSQAPDESIKFISAGMVFMAFELGDTGLVLKDTCYGH